jgi:Protein of unknown function DUF262
MSILELLEEKEINFFEEEEYHHTDTNFEAGSKLVSVLEEIAGIVVASTDWTTATILDQLVRENIQLNPRFQRRDAWTITRKSRFIESIILGFPIPQIVLASHEKERGKFIVLDGKQRLLTILQFYGKSETPNNNFPLKDLEFRPDLNGFTHDDLEANLLSADLLRSLDNQTVRTTLVRNWHTEDFLHKIFLRLNVENTPLSSQELRQALHPGDFINFLDDQSVKSQSLRKVFKSQNPDFRMRDVELLLRYTSFHYFLTEYRGDLKEFMDMTCKKMNNSWVKQSADVHNAVNQFEEAIQTTINIFGERNFSRVWLNESNTYRGQFNRAVLDVMVFYFSDAVIRRAAQKNKLGVENAFKALCALPDSEFRDAVEGRTKNIYETYSRLALWGEALLDILNINFNLPILIDGNIVFDGLR